jgi:hypothetical protein
MDAEIIQREMQEQFRKAGLGSLLVNESSRVRDLGGEVFAEVVLADRTKLEEATELMKQILKDAKQDEKNYSLVVRSKWGIEEIGDPSPAFEPSGGLRAATLIPVTLRCGNELLKITVSVTKLAEWEFDEILGRKTDLRQVARIVVESALGRSGSSYWDPTVEDYLEVASGAAANISRMLKKTA